MKGGASEKDGNRSCEQTTDQKRTPDVQQGTSGDAALFSTAVSKCAEIVVGAEWSALVLGHRKASIAAITPPQGREW